MSQPSNGRVFLAWAKICAEKELTGDDLQAIRSNEDFFTGDRREVAEKLEVLDQILRRNEFEQIVPDWQDERSDPMIYEDMYVEIAKILSKQPTIKYPDSSSLQRWSTPEQMMRAAMSHLTQKARKVHPKQSEQTYMPNAVKNWHAYCWQSSIDENQLSEVDQYLRSIFELTEEIKNDSQKEPKPEQWARLTYRLQSLTMSSQRINYSHENNQFDDTILAQTRQWLERTEEAFLGDRFIGNMPNDSQNITTNLISTLREMESIYRGHRVARISDNILDGSVGQASNDHVTCLSWALMLRGKRLTKDEAKSILDRPDFFQTGSRVETIEKLQIIDRLKRDLSFFPASNQPLDVKLYEDLYQHLFLMRDGLKESINDWYHNPTYESLPWSDPSKLCGEAMYHIIQHVDRSLMQDQTFPTQLSHLQAWNLIRNGKEVSIEEIEKLDQFFTELQTNHTRAEENNDIKLKGLVKFHAAYLHEPKDPQLGSEDHLSPKEMLNYLRKWEDMSLPPRIIEAIGRYASIYRGQSSKETAQSILETALGSKPVLESPIQTNNFDRAL
ncbi:hypothetical protein [Seinonella peptonophila]|uniref:hypothetical protein n=1 Tax=Seinonella peptonophila TaxID=112248 RepID=UPI000932ACE3|nr:hypothetical protein [Seinonella peptonophila]